MDGAVFISFFQGQLESVLEQVVQLAVQEISKTVGSSLSALLLETAVKEREVHRLRLELQSRENLDRTQAGAAGGGTRADGGRTKAQHQHQQQQQQQQAELRAPRGAGTPSAGPTDTRRLEHKGRVVDQLKSVMETVLDFAVCELTKIVEASYDDLLLEVTKLDQEHQHLEERLERGEQGSAGQRRGSEHDRAARSGSEEPRDDARDVTVSKKLLPDPKPPRVQSTPEDWTPILDKVFGENWSEPLAVVEGGSGRGSRESRTPQHKSLPLSLEPASYSPQQDPRWTPLEDMEVFSPDVEVGHQNSTGGAHTAGGQQTGPPPGSSGCGVITSASMLHRLLTLPSQLLEEDATKETAAPVAMDSSNEPPGLAPPPLPTTKELDEDMDDGEEEEEKGTKRKRRIVWSECEDCGRRFSRVSQLKSHRLTHAAASDWVPSPPTPPSSSPPHQCSKCGKRFSSATRLQSHMMAVHPGDEN